MRENIKTNNSSRNDYFESLMYILTQYILNTTKKLILRPYNLFSKLTNLFHLSLHL